MYALAAAAAAAGVTASLATTPNAIGICGAGLALLMAAIAAIDARQFIIPDELNAAALILALVHAGIERNEIGLEGVAGALMRAAALSLLFLGLRIAYRRLRNRDGLGLGDVKLAGVAGAWLSWQTIPLAIETAALAALAAYALRRCFSGDTFRAGSRLPFGLFLAPTIWLGWLLEAMQITQP